MRNWHGCYLICSPSRFRSAKSSTNRVKKWTMFISLLYIMENGSTAEIGVVGNDGMVGIAIFMGGDTTPNRAVVQSAGNTLKLKSSLMKDEFTRGGLFHNLCLRYTQALITQISQTAVCNRLHSVDQQLCRWLLLS